MNYDLANISKDEFEELYSLLCDVLWKQRVSKTPEEFRNSVAEDNDFLICTCDVSRAAATHIVRNILGIDTDI
jgi:hypothetical protein